MPTACYYRTSRHPEHVQTLCPQLVTTGYPDILNMINFLVTHYRYHHSYLFSTTTNQEPPLSVTLSLHLRVMPLRWLKNSHHNYHNSHHNLHPPKKPAQPVSFLIHLDMNLHLSNMQYMKRWLYTSRLTMWK